MASFHIHYSIFTSPAHSCL